MQQNACESDVTCAEDFELDYITLARRRGERDEGVYEVLKMLGLESIPSLIRKRKLQWVARCARRGEEDLTWKRMVREVEDGKSK